MFKTQLELDREANMEREFEAELRVERIEAKRKGGGRKLWRQLGPRLSNVTASRWRSPGCKRVGGSGAGE